jgi:hypothetical protein
MLWPREREREETLARRKPTKRRQDLFSAHNFLICLVLADILEYSPGEIRSRGPRLEIVGWSLLHAPLDTDYGLDCQVVEMRKD